MTIYFNNTNDDNENYVTQTNKKNKQDLEISNKQDTENNGNENGIIESSMEKDSAPSQQLQGTDRKDQEPVEPTGDLST